MAEDRKARLRALAARAGRTKQPAADDNDNDNDKRNDQTQSATATGTTKTKPKPNLSFRNYAPTDKGLGGNSNDSNNNNNGDDSGDAENDESPTTTTDAGPPSSKRPRTAPLESGARNRDPTQTQTMPPPPARTPSDALRKALREAREDAASSASASASSNARVPTETVSDLAPKKSNWDLKRDVADKLARLEKRTQKAIVEILRERLESEAANAIGDDGDDDGGGSDLD